jgi:hypothetical protein
VSCARLAALLCATALLDSSAQAPTLHVPSKYPTIQAGIDYGALRVGRLRSDHVAPDRWARAIAGVPREGMVSGRVRI